MVILLSIIRRVGYKKGVRLIPLKKDMVNQNGQCTTIEANMIIVICDCRLCDKYIFNDITTDV